MEILNRVLGSITAVLIAATLWMSEFYTGSIQPVLFRPLEPSTYYYKNLLGAIYIQGGQSCWGMCLSTTFIPLPESDLYTFMVYTIPTPFGYGADIIDSGYARDSDTVYYRNQIIRNASVQSFRVLGVDLARDATEIYYRALTLPDFVWLRSGNSVKIDRNNLRVISYKVSDYIIVAQEQTYYFINLNREPLEVERITEAKARTYPPFTPP